MIARSLRLFAFTTSLWIGLVASVAADTDESLRIFMILWRGETNVELGLRDYFRSQGIKADFIVRNAERDKNKIAEFIQEAKETKPDLVYTWGTSVTLSVVGQFDAIDPQKHITDIPVVFAMVTSPDGSRIVENRASSGRNVTGVSHVVPVETQVKAMLAYRKAKRIAVIYNPLENNSVLSVRALRRSAKMHGFEVIEEPVELNEAGRPRAEDIPDLVTKIAAREPQFLYLGPDSFIGANRKTVTREAKAHRIPTFTATEVSLRDADALFGLVSRYDNVGRLAAHKMTQILIDKSPPQDIPIETLHRFSYIVKMSVAKELSFYPPMTVLKYAEIMQ